MEVPMDACVKRWRLPEHTYQTMFSLNARTAWTSTVPIKRTVAPMAQRFSRQNRGPIAPTCVFAIRDKSIVLVRRFLRERGHLHVSS